MERTEVIGTLKEAFDKLNEVVQLLRIAKAELEGWELRMLHQHILPKLEVEIGAFDNLDTPVTLGELIEHMVAIGDLALEQKANLAGINLRGISLAGVNLSGSMLTGANLYDAKLSNADMRSAGLANADMRSADLAKADLRWANLAEADLRNAYMVEADLRWVDLSSADLRNADVYMAHYNADTRWPDNFDPIAAGAILI